MPDMRPGPATPYNPEGSFRVSAASAPVGPKSSWRARSGWLPARAGRAQWSGQKGKRRSPQTQQPRPTLFGSGLPVVSSRSVRVELSADREVGERLGHLDDVD